MLSMFQRVVLAWGGRFISLLTSSMLSNANLNSIVTELIENHKNDAGASIASKDEL